MIKAVRSSNKGFKEVILKEGFNIILAERMQESTDKDSRNGLGKSTLIDIIHFCLGSSLASTKDGLGAKEMKEWDFTIDITLKGKEFSITRNTSKANYVQIVGDFSDWPILPEYYEEENIFIMKIKEWNKVLGYLMFDLPVSFEGQKYKPSFRSLISYFMRKGVGAFNDPFKYFSGQKELDVQISTTFLLNLNWEYAANFQIIKDKEKTLKTLNEASTEGILVNFDKSLGELEADKIRLIDELKKQRLELSSFKVHPQYYRIQEQSNELTYKLHEISNKYTLNKQIYNQYTHSSNNEADISLEKVKDLYKQIGVIFPNELVAQLMDVQKFHQQIVKNRKEYLQTEITRLRLEIENQEIQIKEVSDKRAELLSILQTHGALEEYSRLENLVSIVEKNLKDVMLNIESLKRMQRYKSELNIEKEQLLQKARRDLEERESRKVAISKFNNNSQIIYSEPGTLSIDIVNSGYKFDIEIERARSQGVGYMKVFCYDLLLAQLHADKKVTPGILIHDSTIFDGVDERQIAKAIELAARESNTKGFQYICTLNSDIVPLSDFTDEFRDQFNSYVRITLSDSTEDGGLLGFRF